MDNNINQMYQYLHEYVTAIPEIIGAALFDINGNLITSFSSNDTTNFSEFAFDASIQYLTANKLLETFQYGNFEQLTVQTDQFDNSNVGNKEKSILFMRTGFERYMVSICSGVIKLGLIFLDSKRTIENIMKVPYTMPKEKKSLSQQLNQIEREIIPAKNYLICYANEDKTRFQIEKFKKRLQALNPGVIVRTLEDNFSSLKDIADWCDVFIWFHSPNSENSEEIYSLLKFTDMLKKKIISITTNFNTLHPIAATKWALSYTPNIEELVDKINGDLKNYDLNKPKGEWDVFQ